MECKQHFQWKTYLYLGIIWSFLCFLKLANRSVEQISENDWLWILNSWFCSWSLTKVDPALSMLCFCPCPSKKPFKGIWKADLPIRHRKNNFYSYQRRTCMLRMWFQLLLQPQPSKGFCHHLWPGHLKNWSCGAGDLLWGSVLWSECSEICNGIFEGCFQSDGITWRTHTSTQGSNRRTFKHSKLAA